MLNKQIPDKITLKKIKNEFYIDQYGDLRNKIDRGPGHGKDQLAGIISKQTIYPFCTIKGNKYLTHCIVDYLHNGDWYPDIIDHIDRNPLHCNIHNLKRSNIKENNKNKNLNIRNSSSITGISIYKNQKYISCKLNINNKSICQNFNYIDKERKQNRRNIYHWSSYESAWEAAQLFNWLIRKQNGFSVDNLPEIHISFKNKKDEIYIKDITIGISNLSNYGFRVQYYDFNKNKIYHDILYDHKNRKRKLKNKFYWSSKEKAFEIAKTYNYLLRKKYRYKSKLI